jgi:hypothetical protein
MIGAFRPADSYFTFFYSILPNRRPRRCSSAIDPGETQSEVGFSSRTFQIDMERMLAARD